MCQSGFLGIFMLGRGPFGDPSLPSVLNRRQPWRSCGPVLGDMCLDLGVLQQPWYAPPTPRCASHIPRGQSPPKTWTHPRKPSPAPRPGSRLRLCIGSLLPLALQPAFPFPASFPGSGSKLAAPHLPGTKPSILQTRLILQESPERPLPQPPQGNRRRRGEDPALMREGCACSQQQGLKPGDPGPSWTEGQDPTAAQVTQGPRHRQPLTNRPTSAVCRSVGYQAPKLQGPRRGHCRTSSCSV